MESWLKVSCLLCVFGFLREIRPSEPYHTEFMLGEWFNITQDQVNRHVYPIGTYSYLILLILVFLITDFLRYKPVIIANAVTGIIIWGSLLLTKTLLGIQIIEVFFGFYQAAEVAYYSYIYAKVEKKYYSRLTSHTRAAMFVGKLFAGLSGQALITFQLMNYRQLLYISAGSQFLAMGWAFFLPKVDQSLYFHQKKNDDEKLEKIENNVDVEVSAKQEKPPQLQFAVDSQQNAAKLLWLHFYNAFSNKQVVQWSLWYAVGLAGYLQVNIYMQVLWKAYPNEPNIVWNGLVDAALTALAAVCALIAGYLHGGRLKPIVSLILMAALSILQGGCILLASWTNNIYMSYVGYVLFGGLFGFTITVASAELARCLVEDSFALVFGINTLLALALQSLLTLAVVSSNGFELGAFEQFTVYAFYFIFIGGIFLIVVIVQYLYAMINARKVIINSK